MDANTAQIVTTAFSALPGIIGLIRGQHAATNPNAPPMTDAEALVALQQAVAASVARDEALLHSHLDAGSDIKGGGAA